MSITVLWASPDENGLTASAKKQLLAGLADGGEDSVEIHLNERRILNCRACGKGGYGRCMKGECSIVDDASEIYKKMRESDALVLITPVYWHDMSENFKALLDRIRRVETNCNGYLRGKQALLTACAGGFGSGTAQCLCRMEETLSHMGIHTADRIPVERFNQEYMIPALRLAGKNFAEKFRSFRFDDFHFWE